MSKTFPFMRLFLFLTLVSVSACQCGGPNLSNARPSIEARPASLDFGTTAPGVGVERSVEISNSGVADLHLSEMLVEGDGAFTLFPPTVTVIKPQQSLSLTLTFRPSAPGNFAARLLVRSDAQNTPELAVSLSGVAFSTDPCANVMCNTPPRAPRSMSVWEGDAPALRSRARARLRPRVSTPTRSSRGALRAPARPEHANTRAPRTPARAVA